MGGTFDPVHCAHLRLALEVRAALRLDSVRLMPAPDPRLREPPAASPEVRLRLLEAALSEVEGLEADGRELRRPGPTVTADTLQELREELPDASLCLILGMDAISRLDAWIDFERIPALAHIVVTERPGAAVPPRNGAVARLPARTAARRPRRDPQRPPRGSSSSCATFPSWTSPPPACDRCARAENRSGSSCPTGWHDIITGEDLYAHRC